jgi:hypothetical protein
VNHILNEKGAKLDFATTLGKDEKRQVKDIVHDYIKTRLQHAARYSMIEDRKNGGHASLKANNTSLKEIQNTTPESKGVKPIPKPRNSINSNHSDTSLKNAPAISFNKMKGEFDNRKLLAEERSEEMKPRRPRTSSLGLKKGSIKRRQ